jgi:phospholipase/lecithinase/hemolysin
MTRHLTLRAIATAAAASLGLAVGNAQALAEVPPAPLFDGLIVIGDSLSDDGNLFKASGFPPAPYFDGRFSNGPVAVEYLAQGLGLSKDTGYVNLAIGGARTGMDGNAGPNTGMTAQLSGLLAATPALSSSALYVVWGGANDLRADPSSVQSTILNLREIVVDLYAAGARNFLLPNLPDLGLTPEALDSPIPGASDGASFISMAFNDGLAASYAGLAAQWTDETFYMFDAMAAQRAIVFGAPGNGFTDVSSRCLDTRVNPPTLCAMPETYLYWDNIHPTAAAHQILGAQMLAAVPEPQTMLMMAMGVAMLAGWGSRRQRPGV